MKLIRHTLFLLFAPYTLASASGPPLDRGKECEKLALEYYSNLYDRNFLIFTNIEYSKKSKAKNKPQQILGELDIIVIHRKTRVLVDVAEIKCSSFERIKQTQAKAYKQIKRYAKLCFKKQSCHYWGDIGALNFRVPQNAKDITFRTMTYVGDDFEILEGQGVDAINPHKKPRE
jgi:hypothetical protein